MKESLSAYFAVAAWADGEYKMKAAHSPDLHTERLDHPIGVHPERVKPMRHHVRFVVLLALCTVVAGCLPDEPPVKPKDKPKSDVQAPSAGKTGDTEKPRSAEAPGPTYKVEKAPFKVEATLKGVFETPDMTEVAVRPEAWTSMVVHKAVAHGTAVKKGDTLIEMDLEKIDQAIKDLEAERRIAELALKQAEEEVPILERTTPMDLASAERAKTLADEDLKKFLEVDRPMMEKSANFSLENAKHSVEYAQEELRQLEKMYRDKDIREDTEEIILKRQRRQLEMTKFFLAINEQRISDLIKVTLPRQEHAIREAVTKQAVALDKAKATLPLALRQKRVALEKLRYDSEKTAERLARLKRDRNILTVTAPAEGLVYYGKCVRGQWATAAQVAGRLVRGGTVQPEEVVLTIVNPASLFVRATVEEKDLPHVSSAQKVKVIPTGMPDTKCSAKIDQVSPVPVTPGNFEARISLTSSANGVVPGMACAVKLVPYQKADALAVPAAAVFTEELDDEKQFVYQPTKNGKPEKRPVTVGKTSGGKTEILAGLQEGDEILLEKPNPQKKSGGTPTAMIGD
jgi:multidrug resistance efflux pump